MWTMNADERKFLIAVVRGDVSNVRDIVNSTPSLNINCQDPLTRNALIIAIDNENIEMVKLLIECNIKIGDALLYAIDQDFVEAVEILLDQEEILINEGHPCSWTLPHENTSFSPDLTPLIIAAHHNNYEIIKLLLDRKICDTLPDPHCPCCNCQVCSKSRTDDCLRFSKSRINAYKALASPCLMALTSPDPLLNAFELSSKLENLARMEPEYRKEYFSIRAVCQTFATALLDHTRTSKELEILLNYNDNYISSASESTSASNAQAESSSSSMIEIANDSKHGINSNSINDQKQATSLAGHRRARHPESLFKCLPRRDGANMRESMEAIESDSVKHETYRNHMRLTRLRLAVQCKQKTFCAHPNVQEYLNTLWYENLPGFRRRNVFLRYCQVIFIGLMFPVLSISYLIAPNSRLGRYIKRPFVKFICHSASYMTFLFVLMLASQRVEAFYDWDTIIELFSSDDQSQSINNMLVNATTTTTTTSNTTTPHEINTTSHPWPIPTPAKHTSRSASRSNVGSTFELMGPAIDGETDFYLPTSHKPSGDFASNSRSLNLMTFFETLPASSKKRGAPPSPIEMVILIWVLSLIWAEVKQIRQLGMNYYKADMWNTLDSVASGFYVLTIILRFVSYLKSDKLFDTPREDWDAYDPTLISEAFFAAATIFSTLKLIYIFSLNPYLGPLQISLARMIVDILQFAWIYILVLFSFACGMNQLLWYYADLEYHQCLNITSFNIEQYHARVAEVKHQQQQHLLNSYNNSFNHFAIPNNNTSLVDQLDHLNNSSQNNNSFSSISDKTNPNSNIIITNNISANFPSLPQESASIISNIVDEFAKPPLTTDDSCKTWRYFSNVFESLQTLFWATFGLVDLGNFDLNGIKEYTRFWALLMFGCYCFINVVVVLNMLIAMMNHSYNKISKKSDIEWKFARTRLWLSYFETGATVPAPFNLVPSIKSIFYMIKVFCDLIAMLYHGVLCAMKGLFQCNSSGETEEADGNNMQSFSTVVGKGNVNGGGGGGGGGVFNLSKLIERKKRFYEKLFGSSNNGQCQVLSTIKTCVQTNPTTAIDTDICMALKSSYRNVMRLLVRRYLVHEQKLIERKRGLTEAKLNRWAKMNAFD